MTTHGRRAFLGGVVAVAVAPSLAPSRPLATGGWVDFGGGTLVMLHGCETIVPVGDDGFIPGLRSMGPITIIGEWMPEPE